MKIRYAVTFSIAIGLGLGVIATRGLAAPTRTFNVVIEVDEITDADQFEALKKIASRGVVDAKFADGRYLAHTSNVTALDGTAPKAFAIIAFDSVEKAKGYSDNMKETTAMRIKATKSRSFIVEGL